MEVTYFGNDYKGLRTGYRYNIEFNASPRCVWVEANGVQKTYNNLTDFALEWSVIDRDRLNKDRHDLAFEMHRYIEQMNKKLP